jgi:hypothetical protein
MIAISKPDISRRLQSKQTKESPPLPVKGRAGFCRLIA